MGNELKPPTTFLSPVVCLGRKAAGSGEGGKVERRGSLSGKRETEGERTGGSERREENKASQGRKRERPGAKGRQCGLT